MAKRLRCEWAVSPPMRQNSAVPANCAEEKASSRKNRSAVVASNRATNKNEMPEKQRMHTAVAKKESTETATTERRFLPLPRRSCSE